MTAGEAATAPKCPLCGDEGASTRREGGLELVSCPVCREYRIHLVALADLRADAQEEARETLSALARHHAERGEVLEIHGHDWPILVEQAPAPRTLADALEALLLYIGERQKRFSDYVWIELRRFPVTVARSAEDFRYVANLLLESGYAEIYDDALREQFRLTAAGWKRLEELRASRPDSRQAFVAMWFADEMTPAWREGIHPALEAAGYRAVRLDEVQHNEQIDDRIIVEIRRSGLVVADMTGGRGNVYFEAGFAMGLGIPVIWTCRQDHLDDLHFDTRQYNYIAWSTPAELRERLRLRVEATLPQRPAGG